MDTIVKGVMEKERKEGKEEEVGNKCMKEIITQLPST